MSEKRSMFFQRGQIWWLKKDYNEFTPHIMEAKDRYYLVVSCGENNINAPIANVVVISSRLYDNLPMHVPFKMPNGKDSIIECEHIYTKSITKFKEGSYVGVVSDDVMKNVDKALSSQLSLNKSVPGFDVISNMVEEIAVKKFQSMDKTCITDDMILSVCKRISDMFDSQFLNKTEHVKENYVLEQKEIETKKRQSSAIEKFNRRLIKTEEIQNSRKPTKKRRKWTDEMKKQFLNDCESMSPREVMEKYEMSSVKSVYQMKYLISNGK